MLGTGGVEVHHADGLVGPIANFGPAQHHLFAAAFGQLHQGGHPVLRAAGVSADNLRSLRGDGEQIAFRAGQSRVIGLRARGDFDLDGLGAGRGLASDHRHDDPEIIREQIRAQLCDPRLLGVAAGGH